MTNNTQLYSQYTGTTDPLTIAPTIPADAKAILDISRGVDVFSDEEINAVDELLQEYFEKGPDRSGYHFISARKDGHVAGFACFGPRPLAHGTFDLYWIAIDRSLQGHGIGGALSRQVAEEVRALGGRLVVAETSGRPDYEATRRFYETHGYERSAVIGDFYDRGDDLVIYVQRV